MEFFPAMLIILIVIYIGKNYWFLYTVLILYAISLLNDLFIYGGF